MQGQVQLAEGIPLATERTCYDKLSATVSLVGKKKIRGICDFVTVKKTQFFLSRAGPEGSPFVVGERERACCCCCVNALTLLRTSSGRERGKARVEEDFLCRLAESREK